MTQEKIDFLRKTVMKPAYNNKHNPIWKEAFDFYNENRGLLPPLGMGCTPCYGKVLMFIIKNQKVEA